MIKKGLIIGISVLLVIVLGYVFFHFNKLRDYKNNNAIKAVPTTAALILQIKDIEKASDFFLTKAKYLDDLKQFNFFDKLVSGLYNLDTLPFFNQGVFNSIKSKTITVSFHHAGQKKFESLFACEISNRVEKETIFEFIDQLSNSGVEVTKRSYDTFPLLSIKIKSNQPTFHICVIQGILIASYSSILLESSIRQMQQGTSLLNDKAFVQVKKTAGKNSMANLFVNYSNLSKTVGLLLKQSQKKNLQFLSRIAEWGEFDVELNSQQILVNGFIFAATQTGYLVDLFQDMETESSEIDQVTPSNTSFLLSYRFSEGEDLNSNLHNYLTNNKKLGKYKKDIEKYEINLGVENMEQKFYGVMDEEMALVYTDIHPNNPEENKFLVIQTNGTSATLKALSELKGIEGSDQPVKYYQLDKDTKFPIYTGLKSGFLDAVLGTFFPDVPEKYYTIYDNYLIFADTQRSISAFLYSNVLGRTLSNSKYYKEFYEDFSSRDNVFVFCELSRLPMLLHGRSDETFVKPTTDQADALGRFYGAGIQLSKADKMMYMNFSVNYVPVREKEPRTIWQSRLDSTIITKPALVTNHYTKEKEILVQDCAYNLYLTSNSGRILWKKPIDGEILGEGYQVDAFKNNKLQYLFNTKDKIYLVDRNGNDVDRFPIRMGSLATAGLGLFDYDGSRDYRIFIPDQDKQIQVYNISGKKVTGWQSDKTEGWINQPIQHFRVADKDYIVCSDEYRNYIYNRRGDIRVKISDNFRRNIRSQFFVEHQNGKSMLVTSDNNGNVRKIDLSSGETSTVKILDNSDDFYFVADNINKEEGNEYVFVTQNSVQVYNSQGKQLFINKYGGELALSADIYQFSSTNKKIGIYNKGESKIDLINSNGSSYKGFPIKGLSRFSIGFLKSSGFKFNLIVGGDNNYMYNYRVE